MAADPRAEESPTAARAHETTRAATALRRRRVMTRSIAAGTLIGAIIGVIVAVSYANRVDNGGGPLVLAIVAVVLGASIGSFVGLFLEARTVTRPAWTRRPAPRPDRSALRWAPERTPIAEAPPDPDDDAALVPPGWYPDPQGTGLSRFWDGHAWTEHTWRRGPESTEPPAPATLG